MNRHLAALLLLSGGLVSGVAQSSLERMGAILGPKKSPADLERQEKDRQEFNKKRFAAAVQGKPWRAVGGQIYNVALSERWETLPAMGGDFKSLSVDSVTAQGVVCRITTVSFYGVGMRKQSTDYRYVLLKNYPGAETLITGSRLTPMRVMDIGRSNIDGETVKVYDYGTPCAAPPPRKLSEAEIAAAKARAEKSKAEAAAAKLKFHQEKVDKGDSYGQLRMGERYLKGDGVPVDLVKARDLLTKASEQGNSEAASLLKSGFP